MSATTALTVGLSAIALAFLSGEGGVILQETIVKSESTVAVRVDGDCDPALWERASKFADSGDADSTTWAIAFLGDYLNSWDSQCKAAVRKLLKGIGVHRPQEGMGILVAFLQQDPTLPWAETFAADAADSLVAYGASATDYLVRAAGSQSDEVVVAAALGLGRIGGGQAEVILMGLLGHPSAEVRRSALVGLSNSCSAGATSAAAVAMSSPLSDVRGAAMFYLRACGSDGEIPVMVSGLSDSYDEVRLQALRGLIRLSSANGCVIAVSLRRDESQVVRTLAEEYREEVCSRGQHEPVDE